MNSEGFKQNVIESNGNDWSEASELNKDLDDLRKLLVKEIRVEGSLLKSKVAWKISTQVQAYLYRMVELAEACCLTWNNRQYVASITLARALLETAVIFCDFDEQIHRLLENEDLAGLDKFVMNRTFSTRVAEWLEGKDEYKAVNILTLIQKKDRELAGLLSVYDRLSEVAHPNQFGHSQAFGNLNREDGSVVYDREHFVKAKFSSVMCSFATMKLAYHAHKRLQENIEKVADFQHRVNPVGGKKS